MATNVKMPLDLPNPGPLTEAQKALVKSTVPILEKQGPEITRRFYKAMLSANPDLKNTFNNSKQQVRFPLSLSSVNINSSQHAHSPFVSLYPPP